jgi:small subunit ribosomal protein S18
MAKQTFFKRKSCPFSGENGIRIDYKDVKTLSRYISEKGKIIPSRITSVSAKKTKRIGSCH